MNLHAIREIEGDPRTFPWCRVLGAGPVIHRMDGSAVGPMLVEERDLESGGLMIQWETVIVRPKARVSNVEWLTLEEARQRFP